MFTSFKKFLFDKSHWPFVGGAVVALAVGLARAISLRWVCDDIFVTLRYIQNWFDGIGLVYNRGEYVEGYTHFLWLLILAAAHGVGVELVQASIWLGVASYAGVLIVSIVISSRMRGGAKHVVPYAALALAMNYDVAVWASGGLETAFVTLLLSLAFFVGFFARLKESTRLSLSGFLLTLALLTRPDAALFLFGAVFMLFIPALRKQQAWREAFVRVKIFSLPVILILVPYAIWKLFYYGDLLPLTYYAKSGGGSYFDQGFFYLWMFFKVYLTSWLYVLIVPFVWMLWRWQTRPVTKQETAIDAATLAPLATAVIGVAVYLILFVARIGGDFMYGRFIIPMMPFIYFAIEDVVRRVAGKEKIIWLLVVLAPIIYENYSRDAALFDTVNGVKQSKWHADSTGNDAAGETRGIVDERWFYSRPMYHGEDGQMRNTIEVYKEVGEAYRALFAGLNVSVCIQGGQNVIAYYARFPNCVITYGLTDRAIATMPLAHRGRIGHERYATDEYLAQRHVMFKLFDLADKPPDPHPFYQAWFKFPKLDIWQQADVMYYDPEIMMALRTQLDNMRIPVRLPNYETFTEMFIRDFFSKAQAITIKKTYDRLALTYYAAHPNPVQQQIFQDTLRARGVGF